MSDSSPAPVGPRVLIAWASRMGATREIGEAIARRLSAEGFAVTAGPCAEAPAPTGFAAVVIGSAIYLRRWEKSARTYLAAHVTELPPRTTWLFHSGPCGEGAEAEQLSAPGGVRRLLAAHGLRQPITFGGRLDQQHATGPISSWMGAAGPLAGDFRDWRRIDAWAAQIAEQLHGTPADLQRDAGGHPPGVTRGTADPAERNRNDRTL